MKINLRDEHTFASWACVVALNWIGDVWDEYADTSLEFQMTVNDKVVDMKRFLNRVDEIIEEEKNELDSLKRLTLEQLLFEQENELIKELKGTISMLEDVLCNIKKKFDVWE